MLNKRKNNKVSFFALIMLVVTMFFSNVTSINVFAQTIDGESSLTAQSLEINYEEDNVSYYQVYFQAYEEFTSFSLELEFPSFINVESVLTNYQLGADTNGMVGSVTGVDAGQYTCDFQDNIVSVALTSFAPKNGKVRLFTVAISAMENLTQTGEVSVREMQFVDFNENALDVNVELGSITVNKQRTAKMGDVDGDNDVDLVDLITVQRSVTDLSGNYALTEDQKVLADINCDGEVDIVDCQIIRKYLAGLVESLEGYVNPVYEYNNLNIYITDLNGNSRLENTVTLVKETNVLEFLMEYAYSNGITVERWYSDRWCNNEIQDNLNLFVDLNAYGLQRNDNVDPEPEDPEIPTPTSYFISVCYYGENGYTESAGVFEVPAGEYLVSYLRETASGYGTELYSVYPDGSMQEPINEYMTVDEYVNQYGNEVWVTFNNGENGDGGNGGDVAREYTITFYVNGEYHGSQTITAGTNVLSIISDWYITDIAGEIVGVYFDAEREMPVDEVATLDDNINVFIFTENSNSGDKDIVYFVELYRNVEDGGWNHVGQMEMISGTLVLDALRQNFASEFIYFDGIYYDDAMSLVVGESDQISTNISIYIYSNMETPQSGYTINFYGNTTIEALEWEPVFSSQANESERIYEILYRYIPAEAVAMIEGIYYDQLRSQIVSPEHLVSDADKDGDKIINVYMYSSRVGEDVGGGENVNKDNMIYVSIESQNGEQLDYVNIPICEGEYILQTINGYLGLKTSAQCYYNDEYRTQVTDGDVFSTQTNRSIIIVANKIDIIFCTGANQVSHNVYSYAMNGDIVLMRVGEIIDKRAPEMKIVGVYADISLSTVIDGTATVEGDTTVFALFYANQVPSAYYSATLVEVIGGIYTEVNGFGGEATSGNNIISSISAEAQGMAGYIYNIVGYYYDLECTIPVGEADTFVDGENSFYILISLKDLTGEYKVMSMDDGSVIGNITLSTGNNATLVLGEESYSGTWNATMGMLFFNVGNYSQYIFMIMEMGTDVVAIMASEFNREDSEEIENLKAFAGTYTWYEEYKDENGETITEEYVIVLYSNGVHETRARGLAVRGEYEIVHENIVGVVVMGEVQYFTLDKEQSTATVNYLVEYVGTHDISYREYIDGEEITSIIGSFTVNYDGTATYTINDQTVVCTARCETGSLYLCKGDYDMLVINYYTMDGVDRYWFEYMFDGSDYVVQSKFEPYLGNFAFTYYEQKMEIEFYSNGVYKTISTYGEERLGKYDIVDDYVIIYRDIENGYYDEIAYSDEQGAYVLRHLLESGNENETEYEDPKVDVIGGIDYN